MSTGYSTLLTFVEHILCVEQQGGERARLGCCSWGFRAWWEGKKKNKFCTHTSKKKEIFTNTMKSSITVICETKHTSDHTADSNIDLSPLPVLNKF